MLKDKLKMFSYYWYVIKLILASLGLILHGYANLFFK